MTELGESLEPDVKHNNGSGEDLHMWWIAVSIKLPFHGMLDPFCEVLSRYTVVCRFVQVTVRNQAS